MPTLTFTLSTAAAQELVDAMCFLYQYETNALDGETRANFSRRMEIQRLKERVKEYRYQQALLAVNVDDADIT